MINTDDAYLILREYKVWQGNKDLNFKYYHPQAASMALNHLQRENIGRYINKEKYFIASKDKNNKLTEICSLQKNMMIGSMWCTQSCVFCEKFNDDEGWIVCSVINFT